MIKRETPLRVARPTDHLEEVVHFYTEGVGLMVLGSFEDHHGFDGVMLGIHWDRNGRTYEDPDGYRVVLQNGFWSG
jgi:hypothetical protein